MSQEYIQHDLTRLLSHVTPSSNGIIWLGDEQLSSSQPLFYELNYLVDGLLTTENNSEAHSFNYYMTSQFGHPFFLCTLVITKDSDLAEVQKIKTLMPTQENESQVLIINHSQIISEKNIQKELGKIFKSLEIFN